MPAHQPELSAQQRQRSSRRAPAAATRPTARTDVLVMDEHLAEVGHRVEQLERRVQRRPGRHQVDQLVPAGRPRDPVLDLCGVTGEERHSDTQAWHPDGAPAPPGERPDPGSSSPHRALARQARPCARSRPALFVLAGQSSWPHDMRQIRAFPSSPPSSRRSARLRSGKTVEVQ